MFRISNKEALEADIDKLMLWTRDHLDDVYVDNIALLNFYYASVKTLDRFKNLLRLGWDVNISSPNGVTLLDIFAECYTDRPQHLLPLFMCGYNFRSSSVQGHVINLIQNEYQSLFGENEVYKVKEYFEYQSCAYYLRDGILTLKDSKSCDFKSLLSAISTLDDFYYVLAGSGAIAYSYDSDGLKINPSTSIEFDADVRLYTPNFSSKDNVKIVKELLPKFGYYYIGMDDECMLINKGKSPAATMYKELVSIADGTFIVRSSTECIGRIDGTKVSYYADDTIYCDLIIIGDFINNRDFDKKLKKLHYYVNDRVGEHYHLKKED